MTTPATATPAAAPATPAVLPLNMQTNLQALQGWIVDRLTGACGGAMPDGSARWTTTTNPIRSRYNSRRGRSTTEWTVVHRPTGASVSVLWDPGAPGVTPVTLTVGETITGTGKVLAVKVACNGEGRFDRIATAFSVYTARRVEERERERLLTARMEARNALVMQGLLDALATEGLLDLATGLRDAQRCQGLDPARPGHREGVVALQWKVPTEGEHYHLVRFAPDAFRLRSASTDTSAVPTLEQVRALKVSVGTNYTTWGDSTRDTTLLWPAAVRYLRAMLDGALAHAAAALTAREAPSAPTTETVQ